MGLSTRSTFLLLALVALFVVESKAQLDSKQCSTYTRGIVADATTLVGTWYVYAQTSSIHSFPFRCISINFGTLTNRRIPFTINGRSLIRLGSGIPVTLAGDLTQIETLYFNSLRMRIEGLSISTRDFNIISANAATATTYIIVQICTRFHKYQTEQLYIFTSTRNPDAAVVTAAYAAFTAAGLPTSSLVRVDQSQCQ